LSNRKDEIIEISIKLFNEKGCLNTSTRHICESLGISVGNLYYYFKNKEEILIEIYKRHLETIFKEVRLLDYENDDIFLFKDFLLNHIIEEEKHNFIYLELNSIVTKFPKFREMKIENLKFNSKLLRKLMNHQIKYKYIKELSSQEIEFLISNSWAIGLNSINYWNLLDSDNKLNRQRSSLNMYYLIKPYLTKKAYEEGDIEEALIKLNEGLLDENIQ
jgi:AcrR family transcriptional regulator